MKIQYVSDIHANHLMNYTRFKQMVRNQDGADVLVIAGDIADGLYHGRRRAGAWAHGSISLGQDAMRYFKKHWSQVVVCWGNHDFWHGRLPARYAGHTQDIGQVRFICTPLFSHLDKKTEMREARSVHRFPDLKLIHDQDGTAIGSGHYNAYAARCRKYLERQLRALPMEMKAVVVTHHLPLLDCLAKEYHASPWNGFFANDLEDLLKQHGQRIPAWIHGHAHQPQAMESHGVRIVRNPLGYLQLGEGGGYANRILEIA